MTMTPTATLPCGRPGCAGTIEDGFCNVCGLEPVAGGTGRSVGTGRATGTSSGSSRTARTGTARRGGSSTRASSTRRQLGLGLVQVPEMAPLDPATVVMAEPQVPENKRFCPRCDARVTREKGFCPKCGAAYSFIPSLKAGDVVGEQYEILGPMAFGGLGWIYLGKDRALSRWVVLKGLLNAQDPAAAALAVAERQFLAAVKHPNIVGVYNFVSRGTEGYIVMEYVGGRTLRTIRKERGPLPVAEAIAYVHRVLGAFAYLHRQDPALIYCDFKPDNFMVEGDEVRLIDMGGVRRVDDPGGDVYGTKGYSAPEASRGPDVSSDLFTVARTLMVLCLDFRGFQGTWEFTVPPAAEQPLLGQYDSLRRFLVKATDVDPDRRFLSADEMAEQLAGVLREIVAVDTGVARPAESTLFAGDPLQFAAPDAAADGEHDPLLARPGGAEAALRFVPSLKLDPADPAAAFILTNAAAADPSRRVAALTEAVRRFPESLEANVRLARAQAETGDPEAARRVLAGIVDGEWEWRVTWTRAVLDLMTSDFPAAAAGFDAVVSELPGEPAPKLAYALALEGGGGGREADAAAVYERIGKLDPGAPGPIFGLARCRLQTGDGEGAADALNRVPEASSLDVRARMGMARALIAGTAAGEPEIVKLGRAAQTVEALRLDQSARHQLTLEIHRRALALARAGNPGNSGAGKPPMILGYAFQEHQLRRGIERSLRALARLSNSPVEKVRLVDLANEIRPRTLF